MTRRTDRIADLLQAELSNLLLTRVSDPRVRMTTVSTVDVSPDLRQARVKLSIVGSDEQRATSLAAVRHARGFLRSGLAQRLRSLRAIPDLSFELDRGAEHSQRINELLETIKKDDQST